jgi:putative chitinase
MPIPAADSIARQGTIRALLRAGGVQAATVDVWLNPLHVAAERFSIDSRLRLIHWLATLVHESARFTKFEEDLRYRAATLLKLFPLTPNRPWGFTPQEAADYAMQPQKIANRIYADRMGNGNETSGEGWKYRGRGLAQLTGRNNYLMAGAALGLDLAEHPELLFALNHSAAAAGWFWDYRHCNQWADADDVVAIRRRWNGGTIGLEDVMLIVSRMKLS